MFLAINERQVRKLALEKGHVGEQLNSTKGCWWLKLRNALRNSSTLQRPQMPPCKFGGQVPLA